MEESLGVKGLYVSQKLGPILIILTKLNNTKEKHVNEDGSYEDFELLINYFMIRKLV